MDKSVVGLMKGYTFVNATPEGKSDYIEKSVNSLVNCGLAVIKNTIEVELWRRGKTHIIFTLSEYGDDYRYTQNENGSYNLPVGQRGDSVELINSVIDNIVFSCETSGWRVTRVEIGKNKCLRLEEA